MYLWLSCFGYGLDRYSAAFDLGRSVPQDLINKGGKVKLWQVGKYEVDNLDN